MRARTTTLCVCVALNLVFVSLTYGGTSIAKKEPGVYVSANGRCRAELKVAPMGGFLQLYLRLNESVFTHIADDVTGLAWATPTSLVYSASPIYGTPGVFLVTCTSNPRTKMLVGPTNIVDAYPKGADYFELQLVRDRDVNFYYGADVDKIDFATFRSEQALRVTKLPEKKAK